MFLAENRGISHPLIQWAKALSNHVATQASHGLEGPPEHQTDITKYQTRGNTIRSFMEDYITKAVTRGWAHWSVGSAGHGVPPPTFPLGEKLPSDFPRSVPSATCHDSAVEVLVSPLYKYERGAPKWDRDKNVAILHLESFRGRIQAWGCNSRS